MTTTAPDVPGSPSTSPRTTPHAETGLRQIATGLRVPPYVGPLVALVLLCVVLVANKPVFATSDNIINVLTTNSPLMIVAVGMTIAMISGGFDLSVGAVVAATGVTIHLALDLGLPGPMAITVAIVAGLLFGGAANGLLVAGLGLNFFVVTLGTMTAVTGLVYVVTDGQTFVLVDEFVTEVGYGSTLGLPHPILISLGLALLAGGMLTFTPLGRNIYAIGGSKEAARLSGIRVTLLTIAVYAMASGAAAVAGVVQTGLTSAASPTVGTSLALTAGAAVLLGGTSFSGGVGTVTGTVIGVLLIAVLQNGLGLFGIATYWQDVVTGAVLILAVALDRLQRLGLLRR